MFNDNEYGVKLQAESLASLGLLSHFVGMQTDSRSIVSYVRHDYFRRVISNLIGYWVDSGRILTQQKDIKKLIEAICYKNAKQYFNLHNSR